MTPDDYRAQIVRLGLTQAGASRLMGVDARTGRRWALGEVAIPLAVQRLLWACERFPGLLAALQAADERDAAEAASRADHAAGRAGGGG